MNNQPVNLRVDIKKLDQVLCPDCQKSAYFDLVNELRLIPAIVSGNGKRTLLVQPVFKCLNCGGVFREDQLLDF